MWDDDTIINCEANWRCSKMAQQMKTPKKELSFDDLTIDEAIDILRKVRDDPKVLRGVGDDAFAGRKPTWNLSLLLREMT